MAGEGQRPPSRHKDPPQNTGLDLPDYDQDDLPSLDEDSDSSEEFEIELAKASRSRPFNKNQNPNNQYQNSNHKHGANNYFGGADTNLPTNKTGPSERGSGAGVSKP